MERSDPPQHAAATERPKTQKGKRKKEKAKTKRARADALGASGEQTPHTHSSRGEFFFKKACCPRQGRGLCAGSTGARTERSTAERLERGFLEGVTGGAYRYMAMSQYAVLWDSVASLSIASTSLYIRAPEGSNPPPPPP